MYTNLAEATQFAEENDREILSFSHLVCRNPLDFRPFSLVLCCFWNETIRDDKEIPLRTDQECTLQGPWEEVAGDILGFV